MSSLPVTNLTLKQGSGRPIRIANVKDSAGALITNWSGYTVLAHVRERGESTTVLYEWTSQGAGANVSFDGSDVLLEVDADVSLTWTWTVGRYDVRLTNPSGVPDFIGQGHLTIERAITR